MACERPQDLMSLIQHDLLLCNYNTGGQHSMTLNESLHCCWLLLAEPCLRQLFMAQTAALLLSGSWPRASARSQFEEWQLKQRYWGQPKHDVICQSATACLMYVYDRNVLALQSCRCKQIRFSDGVISGAAVNVHHNCSCIAALTCDRCNALQLQCVSPIRGAELLPELLISHQCNVLVLHLNSSSLCIHPPNGVCHLHLGSPLDHSSLATGPPWSHVGSTSHGNCIITCCADGSVLSCYESIGLTVVGAPGAQHRFELQLDDCKHWFACGQNSL